MAYIRNNYSCSLILLNDLIGGKWKQRILWHIIKGDNRFSLLQKAIPDISHKMLITQLRELESSHIIVRHDFKTKPLHVEYYLVIEYQEIMPLLDKLYSFANNYADKNNITLSNVQK